MTTQMTDDIKSSREGFGAQALTPGDPDYDRYQRPARIKRQYDPENVFHLNANIKPALQSH